jgi:hypothetical protein
VILDQHLAGVGAKALEDFIARLRAATPVEIVDAPR